jgi:proline dehydrogenase
MEDIAVFKCPYIDKATIWEKADSFRREHWPDQIIPIDIEKIIEKELNLNIEPRWYLSRNFDTDAYLKNDLTGIAVDHLRYMNPKYENR